MIAEYCGDEKYLHTWLKQTLFAYLAGWKIWFSVFFRYCKEFGMVWTFLNLNKVSMAIPEILNYLVKKGRETSEGKGVDA